MPLVDERLVVRVGDRSYEWIEDWPQLPQTEPRHQAWPHTGVVAISNDRLVTFEAADATLAVLDTEGRLLRTVPVDIGEAHGITRVLEGNREVLWLADASRKRSAAADYNAPEDDASSRVTRVELDGRHDDTRAATASRIQERQVPPDLGRGGCRRVRWEW